MSSPPPTAILFQTHFFDRGGARAFARLAAQCPPHFRPFVLINLKPGEPEPPRLAGVASHVVREPAIRGGRSTRPRSAGPAGTSGTAVTRT
jgi:hypothetical protein